MSAPVGPVRLAAPGPVLPGPAHPPEVVRDTAREVLSRPVFSQEVGWLEQLRDRALAALADLLAQLVGGGAVDWIAWGVVAAVAVAAVAAGVRLVRRTRPETGRAPTPTAPAPARSRGDWRQMADEHARAGRWREAVRCRYHELTAALADGGRLEERPTRTVGELRAALTTDDPLLRDGFERASRVFETVWYAREDASADTLRTLDEQLVAVDARMSA